jgi:spore coat protein CotF
MAKGSGFDPTSDSEVKCNIMNVARALNEQVEMSEPELRALLKKVFPALPNY